MWLVHPNLFVYGRELYLNTQSYDMERSDLST